MTERPSHSRKSIRLKELDYSTAKACSPSQIIQNYLCDIPL
jgi:hypothetical protein